MTISAKALRALSNKDTALNCVWKWFTLIAAIVYDIKRYKNLYRFLAIPGIMETANDEIHPAMHLSLAGCRLQPGKPAPSALIT